MSKRIEVTITYLEMLDRVEPEAATGNRRLEVRRAWIPNPAFNRFLYAAVGADWLWYSRLPWTSEQWREHIDRRGYETWVGYLDGSPAGYFELDATAVDRGIEIMNLGLLPGFIGRGVGQELLEACLERAWAIGGVTRVHLNTCTLDHPRALPNYLAAGFKPYRVDETIAVVPEEPLEPWPGAYRPIP